MSVNRIVINMEGGLIQAILVDRPAEVEIMVIDYDTDSGDGAIEIPQYPRDEAGQWMVADAYLNMPFIEELKQADDELDWVDEIWKVYAWTGEGGMHERSHIGMLPDVDEVYHGLTIHVPYGTDDCIEIDFYDGDELWETKFVESDVQPDEANAFREELSALLNGAVTGD